MRRIDAPLDWYTWLIGCILVGFASVIAPEIVESGWQDLLKLGMPQTRSRPTATGISPRVRSFLDVIAYAEGTAGEDGYRTLFTGKKFDSYQQHPDRVLCDRRLCSSAAGRYQFLTTTWGRVSKRLNLKDFSPESQDLAAVELIRERGAIADIERGDFETAAKKVGTVWASFPNNSYGQPQKSITRLKQKYEERLRDYFSGSLR